jgi:hypothetical protein
VFTILQSERNFFLEKGHSDQLNALQALKQTVLEHHKRCTEETLNHIIYIDKKLDDALKQKIVSDAKENNNFQI